jgi:hypothetical protein
MEAKGQAPPQLRIGGAGDEALVCALPKVFTKTTCMVGHSEETCRGQISPTVASGGDRTSFCPMTHAFARNALYHVHCPPAEVPREMAKLFGMLDVRTQFAAVGSADNSC